MRRHAALIATAFALAACNRTPTPVDTLPEAAPAAESASTAPASVAVPAASPEPAIPTAPQQPAPMPEGSYASYQCDDGTQVEVHFDGRTATVAWPDGHAARLSQSAAATAGQPQVYSNPAVRIERNSDGLLLREGKSAQVHCVETEASA